MINWSDQGNVKSQSELALIQKKSVMKKQKVCRKNYRKDFYKMIKIYCKCFSA